jgi:phosphoglycolate phosphatase
MAGSVDRPKRWKYISGRLLTVRPAALRIVLAVAVLVLWDVDHTLIDNGGVSKETYAATFTALTSLAPKRPARTSGRTDRLIMREMFRVHGAVFPSWPTVYAALETAGRDRFADLQRRGSVLPGVQAALTALSRTPGMVQSLLTGNIFPNARMKITAVGLADVLDLEVGAYGSDSDDRADLVRLAQRRAGVKYRVTFDRSNTVLIGDTTRDIDAAQRGSAQVIAVASGRHTVTELNAAGGSAVFRDLRDTEALLAEIARLTNHRLSY